MLFQRQEALQCMSVLILAMPRDVMATYFLLRALCAAPHPCVLVPCALAFAMPFPK